jgi:hypothetical protein
VEDFLRPELDIVLEEPPPTTDLSRKRKAALVEEGDPPGGPPAKKLARPPLAGIANVFSYLSIYLFLSVFVRPCLPTSVCACLRLPASTYACLSICITRTNQMAKTEKSYEEEEFLINVRYRN